jgi:hypothetical protein
MEILVHSTFPRVALSTWLLLVKFLKLEPALGKQSGTLEPVRHGFATTRTVKANFHVGAATYTTDDAILPHPQTK